METRAGEMECDWLDRVRFVCKVVNCLGRENPLVFEP